MLNLVCVEFGKPFYSHIVGNNNQDEPRVGNPIFQVDSGSCEPECNSDGSCKMTFYPNNGGFKSGSCVSKAFGGNCLGYPTQCGGSSCHSVCGGSSGGGSSGGNQLDI